MAGSAGERTEPATAKRREQSRSRGQVARSREVNTGLGLLAVFAMLSFVGGWLLTGMLRVMDSSLSSAGTTDRITPSRGWRVMTDAGYESLCR